MYLNDGEGFTASPEGSIPDSLSTFNRAVAAGDVDGDGDLDLFVGSRAVVGAYPLAGRHHLLINDGSAVFSDATESLAPMLAVEGRGGVGGIGMITGAVLADVDGDGDVDLVMTHDRGPVRVMFNDGAGMFEDGTERAGLGGLLGRWMSLAAGDVDGDGDVDLVVGNMGLNTMRSPSVERPDVMFFGDFEGLGRERIVEGYVGEGGELLPVRTRPEVLGAMPVVEAVAPDYESYATATLGELFGEGPLGDAYRLEVNTHESVLLVNDGGGVFEVEALPRLAQVSVTGAIGLGDVDGDGDLDAVLGQNFLHTTAMTPRLDAGIGWVLRNRGGDEGARFEVVWPDESGFEVEGQAGEVVVEDVNGDGVLDVLVGVNDGAVRVYLGRGRP